VPHLLVRDPRAQRVGLELRLRVPDLGPLGKSRRDRRVEVDRGGLGLRLLRREDRVIPDRIVRRDRHEPAEVVLGVAQEVLGDDDALFARRHPASACVISIGASVPTSTFFLFKSKRSWASFRLCLETLTAARAAATSQ
jgi:hypothetical protein